MAIMHFEAEPYPLAFEPESTALLMIDMQRDFVEPGGFGEMLGNDVSLLRSTIEPCRRVLQAARQAGLTVIHTREGHRSDLTDAPPSKLRRGGLEVGIGDHGPMGRVLVRGEHGHDIIPELYPLPSEPVIDKPGKGAFHETDLNLILQEPRHQDADRVRRDHGGVRAHHGARGERSGLRMRRAVRLRRLVFPGVPSGRPRHDQGAGRHLRLGVGFRGGAPGARPDRPADPPPARSGDALARRGRPRMHLTALSAGPEAPRIRFNGVIHSVFDQACNIRVDDGRLLALLAPCLGNVPHGARIAAPAGFGFARHLAVGGPVGCRANVLRMAGLSIDLGTAKPWQAELAAAGVDLRVPQVVRAWRTAWRMLEQGRPRAGDAQVALLSRTVDRRGLRLARATPASSRP